MSRTVLSASDVISRLTEAQLPRAPLKACYMSWFDGIVVDPRLAIIPLDDHMVHRGDGVFEALKFINKKPYLLDEHLQRLMRSADSISLRLPHHCKDTNDIKKIVKETLEVSNLSDGLVRIFLSRGTGSFSTNPYDCKDSGLAIAVMELKPPGRAQYEKGVKIGKSAITPKEGTWSQIKSCNYLPNVMMKKESVDRGLDFTVSFDAEGFLAESSTENIVMVDSHGLLCRPKLKSILRGCTMMRIFELAQKNHVAQTFEKNISEKDLFEARELMMVGTTLDVLPVTNYEGHKIGATGTVGPVALKLQELLLQDQTSN